MQHLMKKYNLTKDGAKNLIWSCFLQVINNLVMVIPFGISFFFLRNYMGVFTNLGVTNYSIYTYLASIFICFDLIFFTYYILYKKLYINIYKETANTRINLAEKIRLLPLGFFEHKDLADMSKTIMSDIQVLEQLFSHSVPQFYASIISSTILSTLLIIFNPILAPIILAFIPLGFILFFIFNKKPKKTFKKVFNIQREVSNYIQESFDNINEVKAFNLQDKMLSNVNTTLDKQHKALLKDELIVGVLQYTAITTFELGLPLAAILGSYFYQQGTINLYSLIITLIMGVSITVPFALMLGNYNALNFMKVRIKRMQEISNYPLSSGNKDVTFDNYDITFNNVSFGYEDGNNVVNNCSFTAKQNEVTALIGPSGCGKTTITKLLARFYEVGSGSITIGRHNTKDIDPEELLSHISIVFQDVILFDLSIYDNIKIGNPNASREEILMAARLAKCDEFALKLVDGYDTKIGENGVRLSGGERQRISIARAILKDAPIILLDEASASLDAESESKIQRALGTLIKNKTVIVIAHRLRTITDADQIVVLNNGAVIDKGNCDYLSKNCEYFKKISQITKQ